MKKLLIGIVCVMVVVVVAISLIHNSLIYLRENTKLLKSNVESCLQRRYNLIPNVKACVSGYITHQENIIAKIEESGTQYKSISDDVSELDAANNKITSIYQDILSLTRNYPELESSKQFKSFKVQLEGSENRIRIAIKRYNAATKSYNDLANGFLTSIVAKLFGFKQVEYFSESVN
jgi:LemA protein